MTEPYYGLRAQITPVVIHQEQPVAVEIHRTTVGIIGLTIFGVVMFTHWIACLVFLVTMYRIDKAAEELQKGFQQLGF